jgi:spore germination cell wall hydrolase CwlJ-like protein
MIQLLGNRGASAVTGFFMLALASSEAAAAPAATNAALASIPTVQATTAYETVVATPTVAAKPAATLTVATAVETVSGTVVQTQPAQSVTVTLAPEIAKEANWLHKNGWPLYALVDRYRVGAPLDEQANCVAVAVYHEARGESLEGQLAVARVIMNRAASGKYPASWCGTVKQPWQFSFVNPRTGDYPAVNEASASWAKAVAITRLAVSNAVPSLENDVLWYHATYVAPSWGKRLNRVQKIGTHIFYRS